jgi:hypothetical protein
MRMDGAWWERGMIVGGWGVAALLGLAAIISLFFRPGGDAGGRQPAAIVAQPRVTEISRVEGAARTPTVAVRPTATPQSTAQPENPLASLVTACDVLRLTANWQPSDREWFLTNCLGGSPARPTGSSAPEYPDGQHSGSPPASDPVYVPPPAPTDPPAPTATPVSPPVSASASAISMAVAYLRNSAPLTYDAQASGCSAIAAGPAWVVTCNAPLAGCAEAVGCIRTIGLCVTLTPPAVMSARSC